MRSLRQVLVTFHQGKVTGLLRVPIGRAISGATLLQVLLATVKLIFFLQLQDFLKIAFVIFASLMKQILIIENDPITMEVLEIIVEKLNLDAVCIGEPIDADFVNELNPALILLDHWLDGAFGGDFCRELKSNPLTQHVPVVMISASDKLSEISNSAGANGFLSKPFDVGELEQIILSFIGPY